MQRLFLVCVSLLLVSCSSFDNFVKEKSINRARESFVKVYVENTYDAYACYMEGQSLDECDYFGTVHHEKMTGSGFSIKETKIGTVIMTAGHLCSVSNNLSMIDFPMLISASSEVYVQDKDGNYFSGIILKVDTEEDLCTVLLQDANIPAMKIAKSNPDIGEKVYNLAAPRGIFSPGNIMIFEGYYTGQFPSGWSGYTIPAAPGSSGSVVINKRGEVVGMIDAVVVGFNQISLGPNRNAIVSFLEQ